MLKPNEIRELITRSIPFFKKNPEQLIIYLNEGSISARGTNGLSYQYNYRLNVLITDFSGHIDTVILPILIYLRTNQPELFENYQKNSSLIQFEVDILNDHLVDLSLQIDLTERVLVDESNKGKLRATHLPEPEHPELPNHSYSLEIWNRPDGELLGTIDVPKWQPEF